MELKHILHKHGGRVTSIDAIEHETIKGVASWHYRGMVQWNGSNVAAPALIMPHSLCFDHGTENTPEAQAEYSAISDALAEYLRTHGQWHDPKHTRDGRIYHWTPTKAKGGQSC